MYKITIIAFLSALVISCIITPFARKLAFKVGAMDIPKDDRKIHNKPIPYFGGIAIYIAIVSGMIVFLPHNRLNMATIIGATLLVFVGIVDDMYDMPAKVKLAFQILVAVIAVWGGVRIHFIANPFNLDEYQLLKTLSIPITIVWIVGITNTINLIDGLDGLAAGVSAIAALTFLGAALLKGYDIIYVQCALLAGAALGFLPYNFNPAKIFMGDTGSMLLGYLLSIIAIQGTVKSVAAISMIIPVLAIGLPILDTFFAIIRRVINKKPIMAPDKEHLHHQIMKSGLNQKQTVLILYSISAFLGIVSIFVSNVETKIGISTVVVVVIVILYFAKKIKLIQKYDVNKKKNK